MIKAVPFFPQRKLSFSTIPFGSMQLSYAQLLHDVSRLDENAVAPANKYWPTKFNMP
jgi:hypothetical protein